MSGLKEEVEWRLDHPRRQGDERGNGGTNGQAPLSLPPLKGFFGGHAFLLIVASQAEALGLPREVRYDQAQRTGDFA